MLKFLFTASLVVLFSVFSVKASHALEPGCSPDMMSLLQKQSDAVRARNRAYEREILSRNESTLTLTCFDQALRLSSRLAYIFSDNAPAAPPIQNTVVFTPKLAHRFWGTGEGRFLPVILDSVVSPMYDEQIKNFPAPVPPVPTGPNALSIFVDTIIPFIEKIREYHRDENANNGPLEQIRTLLVQIDALVNSTAPDTAELTRLITEVNGKISETEAARQKTLGPLLDQIKDAVMGPATEMNCTRMDDLWKNGNPASAFAPVEGDYVAGTPYYSLKDLLSGQTPLAGATFLSELQNTTNSSILSTALTDLTSLQPGGITLWPVTPAFSPNATTKDIIDAM